MTFMMYSENNRTRISITVQIRAVLAVIPSCSGENLHLHQTLAINLSVTETASRNVDKRKRN